MSISPSMVPSLGWMSFLLFLVRSKYFGAPSSAILRSSLVLSTHPILASADRKLSARPCLQSPSISPAELFRHHLPIADPAKVHRHLPLFLLDKADNHFLSLLNVHPPPSSIPDLFPPVGPIPPSLIHARAHKYRM